MKSQDLVSSPLNRKTREQKLREKIKETRKKAFIRSNSPSEEYEESRGEKRAQRKLARQEGRLKRIEKRKNMESTPLYGKISSACKAAAKRKFKVWPSAYASGWGVRCTKAGGPSKFGGKK
jgi:hypothetical protein